MQTDPDVVVIGAGGGGPVVAKELGELGIRVLVLEAGPWYGNKKWLEPNKNRGEVEESSDPGDLDGSLYRRQLTRLENDMNDFVSGKFRWGPADRRRTPWYRNIPDRAILWQSAGIGGSTLHYYANCPRVYPQAIDNVWPIHYDELIPYYEKVEDTLPVEFAPTTSKEALFYYGAEKAGFSLNQTLDVTSSGYRPQPNAILPPNEHLMDPNYSLEELSHMEGCTLSGHCGQGCPYGPTLEKMAKRSTNVSYVPLAMKTGNVTFQPNMFVTQVVTDRHAGGGRRAVGVQFRDTWTGEIEELRAKAVVMYHNRVELDPHIKDEHGAVPFVHYTPSKRSEKRREQLTKIATNLLRQAGARKVHRSDLPPNYYIHLQSTMRMGFVVDSACEAYQVKRLYIADNSAQYNSLGGVNPTLTTQVLATRTAERLAAKYF